MQKGQNKINTGAILHYGNRSNWSLFDEDPYVIFQF